MRSRETAAGEGEGCGDGVYGGVCVGEPLKAGGVGEPLNPGGDGEGLYTGASRSISDGSSQGDGAGGGGTPYKSPTPDIPDPGGIVFARRGGFVFVFMVGEFWEWEWG